MFWALLILVNVAKSMDFVERGHTQKIFVDA